MAKAIVRTVTNHRSAVSGQFVKESYVKTHPHTTTTERNKVSAPSKPTKHR
jgi:uncharacterized protein YgbK (DUF1537 family)